MAAGALSPCVHPGAYTVRALPEQESAAKTTPPALQEPRSEASDGGDGAVSAEGARPDSPAKIGGRRQGL